MNDSSVRKPNLFALLIGIDRYMPDRFQDGISMPRLWGCVRDISRIEAFLKMRFNLPQERILKLTAPHTKQADLSEPIENRPTYENIVGSFKQITRRAQPGDHVYIHYSGCGGRARTIFPERKGEEGIDEVLAPMDIANPEARYLRDLELVKLLGEMVAKGLMVTAVLDSCRSTGMTRGRMTPARSMGRIDMSPRPVESLVGSHDELIRAWDAATENGSRKSSAGSGWLPEPEGYTLLSACRTSEGAYEYNPDGLGWNGVLTYWMLDTLEDTGPDVSYRALHNWIVAGVNSKSQKQSPKLQGECDRIFLGGSQNRPVYAVSVIRMDDDGQRIMVGAGSAHGLRKGARFAVYPRGSDFSRRELCQAIIELSQTRSTDSWAVVVEKLGGEPIEQGAQAVLLGAGSIRLVQKVCLEQREELPVHIDQLCALKAVRRALDGNGWVDADDEENKESEADYRVSVNRESEYEIRDGTGQTVKNLKPAIVGGASNAAEHVVQRLVHLAKYKAVKQLDNLMSPLADKVEIGLIGKRAEYDPGRPFEPEDRFTESGPTPTLRVGEWTALRIKNRASRSLNITILDIQPDWGITQVYPSEPEAFFVELGAGREFVICLQAWLPPGYKEGRDILKVFATAKSTNFRWLELPALDKPLRRSSTMRAANPVNPLEHFIATFIAEQPLSRNLVPAACAAQEWFSVQVEVNIKREAGRDL